MEKRKIDKLEPVSPGKFEVKKSKKKINGFVFYATKYTSETLIFYISKKDL